MIARRPLGQTGLLLSAVGVGTTRFPHSELQDSAGLDRCAALLAEAVRSGVNVVDQAFSYAEGHSGEICARLLRLGRIQRAASAEHVVVVYGVDIGAVYLSLGELAFADVDD